MEPSKPPTLRDLKELAAELLASQESCASDDEREKLRAVWYSDLRNQYGTEAADNGWLLSDLMSGQKRPPTVVNQKHAVLLIHGIRTRASWAEMVGKALEEDCGVTAIPIRYGFFNSIKFLSPWFFRKAPIERVVRELRMAQKDYTNVSVIAHSFGTHIIVNALKNRDISLHRIILCGCVVSDKFHRAEFAAQIGPDIILNDCGTHDVWPVLATSCTWGFGSSGTFGMGTIGVRDRFNKFGHGDYFDQEFVKEFWCPFIRDGKVVPTPWESIRKTPAPWLEFLALLPIKYIAIAGLIFGFISLTPLFLKMLNLGSE